MNANPNSAKNVPATDEDVAAAAKRIVAEAKTLPERVAILAIASVTPELRALVTPGSLAPKNNVGRASVAIYSATLRANGIDPEKISFAEAIEVSRRLYGPTAKFRNEAADLANAEKALAEAEAKREREAKKLRKDLESLEATAREIGERFGPEAAKPILAEVAKLRAKISA